MSWDRLKGELSMVRLGTGHPKVKVVYNLLEQTRRDLISAQTEFLSDNEEAFFKYLSDAILKIENVRDILT